MKHTKKFYISRPSFDALRFFFTQIILFFIFRHIQPRQKREYIHLKGIGATSVGVVLCAKAIFLSVFFALYSSQQIKPD